MPIAVPINVPQRSTITRANGTAAPVENVTLLGPSTYGAGVSVGPVFDVGSMKFARLVCKVTAKSGTNPVLDVTIQTSHDGLNGWQTVGTFAQKKDTLFTMGAVTAAGTTPPTITLTSTAATQPVNLKIQCTSIGGGAGLGSWVGRYSVDGGVSWVSFTSAATVAVVDANSTDTGVVINIAAGNAAVDNEWTAATVGWESKVFGGLNRFVRAVALIGGSSTPTMAAEVSGTLV